MTKREQVMDLWRQSFHDSEEFIRFYFDQKYSDENSLVYEENGKALSALLMLPYPMTWMDKTITTSYISGACTLETARNHGLMTLLLKEAFSEMNKCGIALSTLIPAEEWLFKYYGQLGYAAVFDFSIEKVSIISHTPLSSVFVDCPDTYNEFQAKSIYPYFEAKMQERSCCIQHPLTDYLAVIEETYLNGGRLAVAYSADHSQVRGWALAVPADPVVQVKEIFYQSPEDKKALFQTFSQIWRSTSFSCKLPPSPNHTQPYGMARVTDVSQLLQQVAIQHPDVSLSLKVNDAYLPANQGVFRLSQGKCEKIEDTEIPTDIETDIPTLTKAILGYHSDQLPQSLTVLSEPQFPYMNLMLD